MKLPKVPEILTGALNIFPGIDRIILDLDRSLQRARSDEVKMDYLALAIKRIDEIRIRATQTFNELQDQGALDNPEPYWLYQTEIRNYINDISMLRENIRIDSLNKTMPKKHEELEESLTSTFAPTQAVQETSKQNIPVLVNEVMTIDELALYTKWSKSWIYKNYRELGIPYTLNGGLRFRKDSVDDFMKTHEKNKLKPKK